MKFNEFNDKIALASRIVAVLSVLVTVILYGGRIVTGVEQLEERMQGVEERMQGVEERLQGVEVSVAVLTSEVAGLREDVAGLKEDVDDLKHRVSHIEGYIAAQRDAEANDNPDVGLNHTGNQ